MSSKTKIVVLKSKELIYTAIFVVLGILLISLLIYMFSPSKNKKEKEETLTNENTEIFDTTETIDTIKSTDNSDQISENGNDGAEVSTDNQAPPATVVPPDNTAKTNTGAVTYKSGVYSSVMNVGGQTELQLVVTVDNGAVSHIDITNLSESVTAMYPLIGPSLDEINTQLESGVSFDNLTYSKDNQYTTILIIQAARESLLPN